MNNFILRKSDLNRVNCDGHVQARLLKLNRGDDFDVGCRYGTWELLKEKVKEFSTVTIDLIVKQIISNGRLGYYQKQLLDELKLSKDNLLELASGSRTCDTVIERMRDHPEKDSLCDEDRKVVTDRAVNTALENGTEAAEEILSGSIRDGSVVELVKNLKIAKQLAAREDTPVETLKVIYESASANKDVETLNNIAKNNNEDKAVMEMQIEIVNSYQDELKKIDGGYGDRFPDRIKDLLERHKTVKVQLIA